MRLLVILLFLSPVGALQVLTDGSGDVESQLAGNADGQAALGDRQSFDLLNLDVEETPGAFLFSLGLGNVNAETQDAFDNANFAIDFRHEDRSYRIFSARRVVDGDPNYWNQLQAYDSGRGYYINHANVELNVDETTQTMTFTVPRDDLLDSNGAAPYLGRKLEDFRATASMASQINLGQVTSNLMSIWDNMPDNGVGDISYEVQAGVAQSGNARLESEAPMRSSNGDATTFLYDVTAYNDDDQEVRFQLRRVQVPTGWSVTLPGNEIRIGANDNVTFKVLVSVPFAHDHGGFDHFTLELRSLSNSQDVGRVNLGVRYLEVPQPAGHHDTVYLHSRTEPVHTLNEVFVTAQGRGCLDTFPFFNTEPEYEFDDGEPIPACARNFFGTGTRFQWWASLEPGLAMGMDWILNETGDVQMDFASNVPLNNAILSGEIVYLYRHEVTENNATFMRTEWIPVADLLPSSQGSIQGTGSLTTVVKPRDVADRIPYRENSELRFNIVLDVAQPDPMVVEAAAPTLVAGEMRLPLNEYQDEVQGSVGLSDLHLSLDSSAERNVNPGNTVVFNFTLANSGPVDERVRLRVVGPNAEWAVIGGEDVVDVVSGRDRRVTVGVTPPSGTSDQEVAELILSVISTRDPSVQLTHGFAAVVDTVNNYADEGMFVQQQSAKESPLPLLVLVAAIWFVARRVK